ncbi:MAG: hypothetical protein ACFFFH_00885 [Candidatus Thorarchaeota archaeon]
MGIEDGIKNIQQMAIENKQSLNRIQDIVSSLQGFQDPSDSIQNLSMVMIRFEENMNSLLELVKSSQISSELQSAIESLPQMISSLEQSLGTILSTFEKTSEETKNDLKFIKVSYVEDVVGNMRTLSNKITDEVGDSNNRTTALYEAIVGHFGEIVEKLNKIESSLNALVENQADQLATVADVRDRVSAIIQVELASLRDRIAIYLETTINELKTSVTERLATQDGTLQNLTNVTRQLDQNIKALPELVKQQIEAAVETRVTTELTSMEKEMKKMTAFIIRAMKDKDS